MGCQVCRGRQDTFLFQCFGVPSPVREAKSPLGNPVRHIHAEVLEAARARLAEPQAQHYSIRLCAQESEARGRLPPGTQTTTPQLPAARRLLEQAQSRSYILATVAASGGLAASFARLNHFSNAKASPPTSPLSL